MLDVMRRAFRSPGWTPEELRKWDDHALRAQRMLLSDIQASANGREKRWAGKLIELLDQETKRRSVP